MTGEQPDHQAKEYFEAGLIPLSLGQPRCHRARENCYFQHCFDCSAAFYVTESTSRKGSTHMHVLQRTITGSSLLPK